ncbi:Di-copper centre-containing [Cordyceps fumosorosea ARSEF 2679]|uniref:Di-copper centre-containing n=1 Tax=Cordyceps fumosorosea (strain ARSEF 2679) TaxID=1081104 RepID=A0A167B4A6_CORFA|nr:Di-copper centre-containing [Cordyceps fumosorosea ARSEF 2679]OAA39639.1 Di-copper centre-containing [Cordyceps fumosorosea ARSEF 2679]
MAEKGPTPATADTGFIFSMAPPENPFLADTYFQRVLAAYLLKDILAELTPALTKFGDDAISPIVAIGYETEYGIYRRIKLPLLARVWADRLSPLHDRRHRPSPLPGLPAEHPFHETYRRLTARTGSWTSGQWMTERTGGSDVQGTET